MKRLYLVGLIIILFLSSAPIYAQEGGDRPQATIRDTEQFTIFSEHVEDDYRIFIGLPHGYHNSDQDYPVLYLLDPHFMFGTVTEQARLLNFGNQLPQMIIVGIGYPTDIGRELVELRGRDYVPALDFNNGGSQPTLRFLNFITEELIPRIDESYRIQDGERAIMGYSFGGEFTLFALAKTEAEYFNRFIGISPALPWQPSDLIFYSEAILPTTLSRPTTVFMSMGTLEGANETMRNLQGMLNDKDDMTAYTIDIPQATHYSAVAIGIVNGLLSAYCAPDSGNYECN